MPWYPASLMASPTGHSLNGSTGAGVFDMYGTEIVSLDAYGARE
jgi:hypothetical protein